MFQQDKMARHLKIHKNTTSPKKLAYKKFSYKKVVPVVALPGGCSVEVDIIGLPATPRIDHNGEQCVCHTYQAALLFMYLQQWLCSDAILFQIDVQSAVRVVQGLLSRWSIGVAVAAQIENEFREWQKGVIGIPSRPNPLLSGRVSGVELRAASRMFIY
jgi:hypothetical protein